MKKINEYQILMSYTVNLLVKKVERAIKEGWQPYGNVYVLLDVTTKDFEKFIHYQSMVKYKRKRQPL